MTRSPGSDVAASARPIVLIVDDDPDVRQVLRWTLEDAGYAVHSAQDGPSAIERAAKHAPALVVLDIGLPNTDGTIVAGHLRKLLGEHLPLLVMTADGRAAEKAKRAGAYAYLHKPFEDEALIAAVRAGLDRQS